MEMLYLLIVFIIGGVVGGAFMRMWHKANSQGGDKALRIGHLALMLGGGDPFDMGLARLISSWPLGIMVSVALTGTSSRILL